MSAPEIKVEVLLNSVKSLQQEKACLEQKIKELSHKKNRSEASVESVQTKKRQVEDVNTKMKQTLKVAQHKVSQTQGQLNKLMESAAAKKSRVEFLNQTIEQERQRQLDVECQVEEQLSQLSDKFRRGKDLHTPDNLQRAIDETATPKTQLQETSHERDQEVQQLNQRFQQLRLQQESLQAETQEVGIPLQQQTFLLELFASEAALLDQKCVNSCQQQAELKAELTSLVGQGQGQT